MKYCSNCSKSLTYKIPEDDTILRYVCDHCGMIHYQNPRMVVGCIPVWQNKILMCKRAIEPKYGLWTIPAGFMENGETVEEGAIRETTEESGANVKIVRLHTIYSLPNVNQVYAIFLADMVDNYINAGAESLECKLCKPEELPWDELAFTAVEFSLKKYIENLEHNSNKTYLGSWQNLRK